MPTNFAIYLKALDDKKYLTVFLNVLEQEESFISNCSPERSALGNFARAKDAYNFINSEILILCADYDYFIKYIKSNCLNHQEIDKTLLRDYQDMFISYCDVFDQMNILTKELSVVKNRSKRRKEIEEKGLYKK